MILERDGNDCVWCRRTFDNHLVVPTTEHLVPRIKGGPSWVENEVAACKRCNNERGHRTLGEFADECEGLAREPDVARIIRSLERLTDAIAIRVQTLEVGGSITVGIRRLGSQIARADTVSIDIAQVIHDAVAIHILAG